MKPFTFTRKSDRHPSLNRSLTSPQLSLPSNEIMSTKHCFQAKPFPKNFFSNYFYHKMWEDEYFRTLNRKLRAEELLKISSLPPSMRKRDKTNAKSQTKSERCTSTASHNVGSIGGSSKRSNGKRKKRPKKKVPDYCHSHDIIKTSLSDRQNDFITTCPDPFKFETEKRCGQRSKKV